MLQVERIWILVGGLSEQGSVRTKDSILEHAVPYIGHVVQLLGTVNPSGSTPL